MDKEAKLFGTPLSRREMLKLAGMSTLSLLAGRTLTGCAAPAPPVVPTTAPVEVTRVVPGTPVVVTATPAKTVTVELWQNWAGILGKAVERLGKRFEDTQPYVKVNALVTEVGVHPEKLVTAIAGGNPPDLVTLSDDLVLGFVSKGQLLALDDFINASKVISRDNYTATMWEPVTSDGKTYGVPSVENAPRLGLGWNKTLFKKAGLDPEKPPTTLDQLSSLAEQLTKTDASGNLVQIGFDPLNAMGGGQALNTWARAFGANWYDPKAQKVSLNSPEMVAMVDYIVSFYKKYGPQKMTAFRQSYAQWSGRPEGSYPRGVEAMIVEGYWAPGELKTTAQPGQEFGWTWMPTKSGDKIQLFGGWHLCIPKGAKNPEAAFKVIEFFSSDDSNLTILDMAGSFCGNKSFSQKTDFSRFGGLSWFMESITKATKTFGTVRIPVFAEARDRLLKGIEQVNFGQKTTQAMLDEVQTAVQSALDKAVKGS